MRYLKNVEENDVLLIVHQILNAFSLLHAHNITVKNLKPSNILMMSADSWDLKINDVGLSCMYD